MKILLFFERSWWKIGLITIIIICILLIGVTFYYYLMTFRQFPFSNEQQNWGVFGDYIGGTLNPLLAVINICVTIWLAFIVNKISNSQIKTSRHIALTSLKHEALKELRNELNGHFDLWRNNHNVIVYPTSCLRALNNFYTNYDYLFDLFEIETYNSLDVALNNAINTINNTTNNTPLIMQNFQQANAGRQALLADLGQRTLK